MAIVAATGTARRRVIPAVREQSLFKIVAIYGRDDHLQPRIQQALACCDALGFLAQRDVSQRKLET